MGCIGCSCSTGKDTTSTATSGCRSNGGCATGGCNRHNTYDWITALGISDAKSFDIVEVSFKNGSRKEFFRNPPYTRVTTGDWVLVESYSGGFDVGQVALSGELVRLQMKRKRVRDNAKLQSVIRKAHERDLERLDEVRRLERDIMIKARVISRNLGLDMKIGDVEFQGDGRKCTFYYTADGRVDFRELIRLYARDFKVKIEMRQIGARQESARIGGLGNCGRELCCSTWLTEFKSVNTAAARYQNLAINQTKLSGMCGRLKCCLNYELDAYIDALEDFPDKADRIRTAAGTAVLVKTDVFKRIMFYAYADNRGRFFPLHVDQVWQTLDLIKQGQQPAGIEAMQALASAATVNDEPEEETYDYDNVGDVIQLPIEKRKKKKKKKNRDQSAAAALENGPMTGVERDHNPPRMNERRPDSRSQGRPDARRQEGGNRSQPQGPRQDRGGVQRPNQPRLPQGQGGQQQPRPPRPPQDGAAQPPKPQQKPPQSRPNQPHRSSQDGAARPPQERGAQPQRPPKGTTNQPQRPPQSPRPPQDHGEQPPRPPQDRGAQQPPRQPNQPRPPQGRPNQPNRPPQGRPNQPKPPQGDGHQKGGKPPGEED